MSTLVSYLLAAILQFIGVNMPAEEQSSSVLPHQQCEQTAGLIPYSFINNSERKQQHIN